jgi:hypothetical protein
VRPMPLLAPATSVTRSSITSPLLVLRA